MNINECVFENNKALNGGAIYLNENLIIEERDNNNDNKEKNINIDVKNTIFLNNKAQYYGGAVYSDIKRIDVYNLKNISFIENTAYAGGALYINGNNASLFQYNDIIFLNNKSESHGNDLATGPFLISHSLDTDQISIKSGEIFPLEFTLTDKLNQTVNDMSKYYSNIILSVNIEEYNNNVNDIIVLGNICNFSKGKCELNNFKIYAKSPLTLNLRFSLDNESKNIIFKNDILKIVIKECEDNEIKMHVKGDYYYCKNPFCGDDCPPSSAICIKNTEENINDINSNICQCIEGWTGEKCQIKEYAKIK
ncbi:hypothetical protein PIROE2DRAFT_3594 [Piromyces sp. E2]|nr:hypothetical protein PIROE2DRAFT_3594 [Piromyces sp. E2]|eukprot:OUM68613.1 hypothetical protein PIROE2DRAFT_3594 [Piromyces sp. E2]